MHEKYKNVYILTLHKDYYGLYNLWDHTNYIYIYTHTHIYVHTHTHTHTHTHIYIQKPEELSWYSDSLRAGRFGDRIPVRARFSTPVQTGPGAHPTSYTMGTGSFPGVKQPGHGVDHPPLSSAEVKERVGLYIYSPSGSSWPVRGLPLPLPFTIFK